MKVNHNIYKLELLSYIWNKISQDFYSTAHHPTEIWYFIIRTKQQQQQQINNQEQRPEILVLLVH